MPEPRFDDATAWIRDDGLALAIRDGGDLLLTCRRPVAAFAELTADERDAVFRLLGALEVPDASVRFALRAPEGARWCVRVSPAPARYADLPGFVGGEDQPLLPAIQAALRRSESIDLLAAFIQPRGIELLRGDLEDALRRDATVRIRVLCGDYRGITHPDALRRLAELCEEHPGLEARLYRCEPGESFHPKAYIFAAGDDAIAYVGSSNLSGLALTSAVEWNLRALARAHAEVPAIRARFDRLWQAPKALRLTQRVIDEYAAARVARTIEVEWEPPSATPTPHPLQAAALRAIAAALARGATRGLVVLATGLGKTLLAAFAAAELGARRVLFVAHREEILVQARRAFARVLPDRSSAIFAGARRGRGVDLIFASVQTLSRREHLAGFGAEDFDLVIVDEFHHAAASTYRRLLDHFRPRFLLGVTATPERGDGGELLSLCDDNLLFRAGIREGIEAGRLVPFAYFGVRDAVDYAAIPWRSGRFDPAALSAALATRAHADAVIARYLERAPAGVRRGLWFCQSIEHARFMAAALCERGIAAVAVHSGPGGAPRSESLRRLEAGELEAITTVDVFNEGVDVPAVNVVVLLRPTESRVVFLQQIGRGLRVCPGGAKERLVVLDVIGNHRSFLRKPQALLALLGRDLSATAAVRRLRAGDLEVPIGCTIDLVEVTDLLERIAGDDGGDALSRLFDELRDELGRRPRLAEYADAGGQVRGASRAFGSWWQMLADKGELGDDESRVFAAREAALAALEEARSIDPAPWEALRAWVTAGGVDAPVDVDTLPPPGEALVELWPSGLAVDPRGLGLRDPASDADVPVLEDMIDEIAEARLAALRRRESIEGGQVLQVKRAGDKPILRFTRGPETPPKDQWTAVWAEGERYELRFVKIAVNVARRGDDPANALPALLRRIFGADAGANGTDHRVLLRQVSGRWELSPIGARIAEVIELPFYPALAVACGRGDLAHDVVDEASTIAIRSARRVDPRRHFVVRARGDSMKGGSRPIADGDLVLCERVAAATLAELDGRACLLVVDLGPGLSEAMIKAPTRRDDGRWVLRSWSEGVPDLEVDRLGAIAVVARALEVVVRG